MSTQGPAYCRECGSWPGLYGPNKDLCTVCDDVRHTILHPVPHPPDPINLAELYRKLTSAPKARNQSDDYDNDYA